MPATRRLAPLFLAPQILFTLGVCWFLAALGAFVRDLDKSSDSFSPYGSSSRRSAIRKARCRAAAMTILSKNPIFILVRFCRAVFLEGQAPAIGTLAKFWALALFVFFAGYAWFYKLRRSFADIV